MHSHLQSAALQFSLQLDSGKVLFRDVGIDNDFVLQKLTKDKYKPDFTFQDPVAKYNGVNAFQNSLAILRALFKVDFVLHSTAITGDTQITTR